MLLVFLYGVYKILASIAIFHTTKYLKMFDSSSSNVRIFVSGDMSGAGKSTISLGLLGGLLQEGCDL